MQDEYERYLSLGGLRHPYMEFLLIEYEDRRFVNRRNQLEYLETIKSVMKELYEEIQIK